MAAAAPVVVQSPAGAPTADCPLFLPANSDVVSATPCLDWQPAPAGPGGAARVQLASFQMIKAFLPRCRISRAPADGNAAGAVSALTIRLTDAAWSRILTEYQAAGIFTRMSNAVQDLHDNLQETTFPNPASLELIAGDWRAADPFVMPNGNGAAAVNLRRDLTPIRFLSLLRITVVEDASSPLPLGLLAAIVGALGPCLTQASRRAETATVQLTAATLRLHLAPTAPTDALLARKTPPFVKAKLLPHPLRSHGVAEEDLREELEDGIEYKSSNQGRLAVEEKRVHLLGLKYAPLHAPYLARAAPVPA